MYFKSTIRKHPDTGRLSGYYRLVESYRNGDNRICHRTIVNVGFMEDATPEQLNKIQKQVTEKYERRQPLFEQEEQDPIVKKYVEDLWQRIVASHKLDIQSVENLSRMVNADTLQHSNVGEIGAENICHKGEKRNSKLAKFGRSKEKRSDAKLVVLALVINTEGFIKYSSVLQGNIADCQTLSAMIEKLATHTCGHKAVVVLDAGIATDENLELITQKGYKYLCVSRTKLKDYQLIPDRLTVLMDTKSKQTIRLKSVTTTKNTDYYLQVKSQTKALKETAMKTQFEHRFEVELQKIHTAIHRKGGIKKIDKVHQRVGRAKEKYPSVQQYYNIEVSQDKATQLAKNITWQKDETKHEDKTNNLGIYFLRTNLNVQDEVIVWNIYNTIREIENTFRTLKTDLDLRPIYHKNDDATMAHLHLGLLAYWLVNTVKYQLKNYGINSVWSEIVRIGNTQKVVTTAATNTYDKTITTRRCSQPNEKLTNIYNILKLKHQPFTKRKSVVHKLENKKDESQQQRLLQSG